MTKRRMRDERSVNKRAGQFSTTDAHGLTQMGEGFSTEGNEANEETTNELESTPISDSDFTGDSGEGTESEFSTTDGH
jgi:hypothetical protein